MSLKQYLISIQRNVSDAWPEMFDQQNMQGELLVVSKMPTEMYRVRKMWAKSQPQISISSAQSERKCKKTETYNLQSISIELLLHLDDL